jgi:hypothetical protein
MSDVGDLLGGGFVDVVERGGQVNFGHVLPGEVSEFWLFIWVEGGVVSGVVVSSHIAEPYVISQISHKKCRRLRFHIRDPRITRVQQSMLKVQNLPPRFYL